MTAAALDRFRSLKLSERRERLRPRNVNFAGYIKHERASFESEKFSFQFLHHFAAGTALQYRER